LGSIRGWLLVVLGASAVSFDTAAEQAPARDVSRQRPAASSVRGRVVADDTLSPLVRARVNLTLSGSRSRSDPVYTDGDGRFEFGGLPAGSYTLAISKTGYVWGKLGAREVERSIQFELADRTTLDGLDVRLVRAAALSGRVVDDLGDPLLAVSVSAGTLLRVNGQLQMSSLRATVTDDRGEFRIGGLFAGSYVVRVEGARAGSLLPGAPDEWRRNVSWAQTYFPGTPDLASADRLALRAGEERSGVDVILRAESSTGGRLTVTVIDQAGNPAAGSVRILGRSLGMAGRLQKGQLRVPTPLEPGEYLVAVQSDSGAAAARVVMAGEDASLALTLGNSAVVTGRVIVDGGFPADLTQVPLAARSRFRIGDAPGSALMPLPMRINPDGTFSVVNAIGPIEFVSNNPNVWQIRSVTHEDRSLLDSPIELFGGEELTNIRIVVTSRIPTLTGTILDSRKSPTVGCAALIFPDDGQALESGRLTRRVNSGLDGRFRVMNLSAGSYFVLAMTRPDPLDWSTPAYLAALRPRATRVRLDGDDTTDVTLECLEQP
jgi:hypothetical protein